MGHELLRLLGGLADAGLVLGVVGLLTGPALIEHNPAWLGRAVAWAAGWPREAVSVGRLDLSLRERRFVVEDLVLVPPNEREPRVAIDHLEGALPALGALWTDRRLDLGQATVRGLRIEARTQGPPRPLAELEARGFTIAASRIELSDGWFDAPAAGPLPPITLGPVRGVVDEFAFTPRIRWWHGVASAEADRFALGAITLDDVVVPALVLAGYRVQFLAADFRYGPTRGLAWGTVDGLQTRAATDVRVIVVDARLEDAVGTAIGRQSPLRGELTVDVTLRSGGLLPPGGARFAGWVRLADAAVHAGPDPSLGTRAAVRLLPWSRPLEPGWIGLGDLIGHAEFGRGWVEISSLERPGDRERTLQAWGSIRGDQLELFVRTVPRREGRPGLGVAVEGPVDGPTVRWADRSELEAAPPLLGENDDR